MKIIKMRSNKIKIIKKIGQQSKKLGRKANDVLTPVMIGYEANELMRGDENAIIYPKVEGKIFTNEQQEEITNKNYMIYGIIFFMIISYIYKKFSECKKYKKEKKEELKIEKKTEKDDEIEVEEE